MMLDKLIEELTPYTFSSDMMNNIISKENIKNKFKLLENTNSVNASGALSDSSGLDNKTRYFKPYQKDTLFWCFYYITYGELKYQQIKNHYYENEKNMKISSIKELREKKNILKQNNIRLTEIENNLASEEVINEKVLHALCLIYEKRIIIVKDFTYLDIGLSENIDGIIFVNKGDYKLLLNNDNTCKCSNDDSKEIYKDKFLVTNPQKPIRTISYYTLANLHEIANCLKINIYDTNGKKLLKKTLYENILAKF
tara:strand:+ start:2575 stop:3336 length:762 start_codon:yes stop_codon:yes gene_type:complete